MPRGRYNVLNVAKVSLIVSYLCLIVLKMR